MLIVSYLIVKGDNCFIEGSQTDFVAQYSKFPRVCTTFLLCVTISLYILMKVTWTSQWKWRVYSQLFFLTGLNFLIYSVFKDKCRLWLRVGTDRALSFLSLDSFSEKLLIYCQGFQVIKSWNHVADDINIKSFVLSPLSSLL